ncbi:MAG TPA: Calx-beta domain-containing protein [Pyrinomonadaceae bacterium]
MRSLTGLCCLLLAALSLGLGLYPARRAAAAASVFNVNSLADTHDANPLDGLCADAAAACTLRAALEQANVDPARDVIGFGVTGTINLTGALPDLLTDVDINGPGAQLLTVRRDTGGDYRVFNVGASAAVAISGLTVSNGRTGVLGGVNYATGPGGGVFNAGSLTLTGCVVSGNSTADAPAVSASVPGGGGGVYNEGTLVMTGCTVSDNFTGKGGAGAVNSFGGTGGGIANVGALTLTDCLVTHNRTGDGGAAAPDGGDGGAGGGLANLAGAGGAGVVTLTNSVVSNNRTGDGGQAMAGGAAVSGSGGFGGGVYNNGTMRLDRSSVGGNVTGVGGGAGPGALGDGGSGGGVFNAHTLTIVNTVVRDNTTGAGAPQNGGMCRGGSGGDGGGVASPAGATLKVSHSTVMFNQTGTFTDPCAHDGRGGGLYGAGRLRSTIVSNNFVRFPSGAREVSGAFESLGYNYIGIGAGCCNTATDRHGSISGPGFNLRLDPATLVPLPGGLALDAGLARDVDDQPVTTDRRGLPRPVNFFTTPPQAGGDDSDIGALERQESEPPPPLATAATGVGFNGPGGRVTEGCVAATVGVSRSGPLDGRSEVNYVVADKTATQRGDFVRARGHLTFNPGDDFKGIPVLVNEDAYAEGAEELTVTLTDLEGGTLSGANPFTLQIDDDDAADGDANPIDDSATFVCQHYHDFLGRQADAAGQAFWAGQLDACGGDAACLDRKRVDVSAAFFLSIEFQATGFFVIRVNKAAFGDRPGVPRYLPFLAETREVGEVVVGQLGWEQLLEANMRRYVEQFVARPDFQAAHGGQGAAEYVDSLFAGAGATPSTAERDAALAAFGSGDAAGRAAALRSVAESGSVYNKLYNPAFVLMQYFAYLRRNPDNPPDGDFAGYDFWLAKLDEFTAPGEDARDEVVALARVRRAEMVRAFLLSGEYRGRFQGEPNRGAAFGTVAALGGGGHDDPRAGLFGPGHYARRLALGWRPATPQARGD